MNKLRYLIIGSGYRAAFYGRIARTYPERFQAMYLCRSEEKAALMRQKTGVGATVSREEAERFSPDFVAVAVSKGSIADVCAEWAERGYPVLSETPAGASLPQLERLWELHETQNARIVVCEQYHRYPELVAGLDAAAQGKLGTPQSAYLSLAHDYHAASLLRRMLSVDGEAFTMRGESVENPIVETDSRYGPITDGRVAGKGRSVLHIAYASGKRAIYDFSGVQYHSFIRSRHLTVRGDRGEWSDNLLLHLDEQNRPRRECLRQTIPPRYRSLDTPELRELRRDWHPELRMENAQDEYAIATMLLDMGAYLKGGSEPYSLREALDDACFWLLAQQAVAAPWMPVESRKMPWNVNPSRKA